MKSREELQAELDRLRELVEEREVMRAARATHQEELELQQEELLDAQRQAEAARNRYLDLYEFAPVPYLSLDHHGVVRGLNLTAADLLGVERSKVEGMPLLGFVRDESRSRFLDGLGRWRGGDGPRSLELGIRSSSGAELEVEVYFLHHQEPSGQSTLRIAMADLTARRRAESDHRRLEMEAEAARAANETKDRFLAILSHELRTPLTPILALVDRLRRRLRNGASDPEIDHALAIIERNVRLEARLIDDLLDVSAIQQSKIGVDRCEADIHELLRRVLEDHKPEVEERRLDLAIQLDAPGHHVLGDEDRLVQIFTNLLMNAIRYTPRGGRILVQTSAADDDHIEVSLHDSGIGLEPGQIDSLFVPFKQMGESDDGSYRGLGLGLAICRGYVEAHGGTIRASSEGRGMGSTFLVELPTCEPSGEAAAQVAAPLPIPKKLRVLLVEDHRDTAGALAELLRLEGLEVRVAESVAEALEVVDAEAPDVVVSDVGLADGSGHELMEALQQRGSPIPGVAVSGYGTAKDRADSRQAGFSAHLTKPIDLDQLLQEIAKAHLGPGDSADSGT